MAENEKIAIEDLTAGNAFRDSIVPKADGHDEGGAPLWFGWAIMAAFRAGAAYARANSNPN